MISTRIALQSAGYLQWSLSCCSPVFCGRDVTGGRRRRRLFVLSLCHLGRTSVFISRHRQWRTGTMCEHYPLHHQPPTNQSHIIVGQTLLRNLEHVPTLIKSLRSAACNLYFAGILSAKSIRLKGKFSHIKHLIIAGREEMRGRAAQTEADIWQLRAATRIYFDAD